MFGFQPLLGRFITVIALIALSTTAAQSNNDPKNLRLDRGFSIASAIVDDGNPLLSALPRDDFSLPGDQYSPSPSPDFQKQLDVKRQLDRQTATERLNSIPKYVSARNNRTLPKTPSADLAQCVSLFDRTCLLREALIHAYRVPDEDRRDWALEDITTAFAEGGANDHAYQAAALIEDPRRALRSLEKAMLAPNFSNQPPESVPLDRTGDTDPSEAVDAAERGDWKAAFKIAAEIRQPRFRSVTWAKITQIAVNSGALITANDALRQAEKTVLEIRTIYGQSYAQYQIALARNAYLGLDKPNSETEHLKSAFDASAAIELPHLRADAFRRLAAFVTGVAKERAYKLADDALNRTHSKIRQVYVLTGPTWSEKSAQRAVAIAAGISDHLDRARAFLRLATFREGQ